MICIGIDYVKHITDCEGYLGRVCTLQQIVVELCHNDELKVKTGHVTIREHLITTIPIPTITTVDSTEL